MCLIITGSCLAKWDDLGANLAEPSTACHRTAPPSPALSVIFLCYKCISICAKVVHIAYQPISAEIYVLAAYSVLAQEYHVRWMHMGRHICDLAASVQANHHEYSCATCMPADI